MKKILLSEYDPNMDLASLDSEEVEINAITPLHLSISNAGANSDIKIASLFLLAEDINKKLFILLANYHFDDDLEIEIIRDLPFMTDNIYISNKVVGGILMNTFDTYIVDFTFESSDDKLKSDTVFSFIGLNSDKTNSIKFMINNVLFSSLNFVSNYISDTIINNHDLATAISIGFNLKNDSELIPVEQIIDIVSMAPTESKLFKQSSSIAVIFTCKSSTDDKYTLMVPFDIDTKIPKSMFRGMTVDKMSSTYLSDKDQYVSSFMFDTHIENLDKDYLAIRAKNKNNETKLFMLDYANKRALIDKISGF